MTFIRLDSRKKRLENVLFTQLRKPRECLKNHLSTQRDGGDGWKLLFLFCFFALKSLGRIIKVSFTGYFALLNRTVVDVGPLSVLRC